MNHVREFRIHRLLTQKQLARKAGVALRTISSIDRGANCRMDSKRKILIALGVAFEDRHLVFPEMESS